MLFAYVFVFVCVFVLMGGVGGEGGDVVGGMKSIGISCILDNNIYSGIILLHSG